MYFSFFEMFLSGLGSGLYWPYKISCEEFPSPLFSQRMCAQLLLVFLF